MRAPPARVPALPRPWVANLGKHRAGIHSDRARRTWSRRAAARMHRHPGFTTSARRAPRAHHSLWAVGPIRTQKPVPASGVPGAADEELARLAKAIAHPTRAAILRH